MLSLVITITDNSVIMCEYKNNSFAERDYLVVNNCGLEPRCFNDLLSNTFVERSKIAEGFDTTVLELQSMLDAIGISLSQFVTRDRGKFQCDRCDVMSMKRSSKKYNYNSLWIKANL